MKGLIDIFLKFFQSLNKRQQINLSEDKPLPEIRPVPTDIPILPVEEIVQPAPVVDDFVSITSEQLLSVVPGIDTRLESYLAALNSALREFKIVTPLCKAAFIAQTAHESMGYMALVENLNYSAQVLISTWPTRFNTDNSTQYARQPEKIANKAYGGRLGNGDEASGDGWRYRGRGIIQVTGKDNYKSCAIALGLDLINSPELLEQPLHAFRSAGWYWNSRNISPIADSGDFVAVTKKINGGVLGLDDRQKYYNRAKIALQIS